MRVVFLGTGGYHPNERRHTACVMLPEIGVIFDAGTSFFRVPQHLETAEVQIFLSHAHLDHVVGLTYFLVPLIRGHVQRARLYGTQATLNAVTEHLLAAPVFPVCPKYELIPLPSEVPVGQGGVLTHRPLEHPGGATGYRVDWPDRSMAYITDTTADDSYREFIQGVDILIHECYFPDEMAEWSDKTGHSNTTPVAELAREAGVKRLMLVHVDPQRPEDDPINIARARAIFPRSEVAEDLQKVEF